MCLFDDGKQSRYTISLLYVNSNGKTNSRQLNCTENHTKGYQLKL